MFNYIFLKIVPITRQCGTSGTARQAKDSYIIRKMQEYRHMLVLFNTHCFRMATMVMQTCLNTVCVFLGFSACLCGLLSCSNFCLP